MAEAQSVYDLIGLVDNLHEPQPFINKRESILGVVISFMVVEFLCLSLRLYVRLRIVRSPGWDDLFVVLASLSTLVGSICICLATNTGMGQHLLLLSKEQLQRYLKTFWIANASYCSSTTFIKISLLLQYVRIFDSGSQLRHVCIGLAVFTGLWGIAYTILAWIPCIPVHDFWESPPGARCFGYGSLKPHEFAGTFESHTATNMVLDLAVLAIPLPLYFRKGTHGRMRASLVLLLLAGTIVNFVSIWRLVTIIEHRATTWPTFDPTWYGPISIVLAAIEVDTAVMCASAPVFWPIIRHGFGQIFVTKEVEITREHRLGSFDDLELQLGPDRRHGRADSETGLSNGAAGLGISRHDSETNKRDHYGDSFVVSQVDPFRRCNSTATKVEGGTGKKVMFES